MAKRIPLPDISGLLSLRRMRRLASRTARRLGYYLTRDPASAVQADHLTRLFNALKINCVLDVGAHYGDFGTWLRGIGYAGLIVSFEPVAENFAVLEERSGRDTRWHAHQTALGSTAGTAELHLFSGNTFHSFLESSDYGRERFTTRMHVERSEVVRVERLEDILDGLVRDLADPAIFLKVDTQGFDLEVVRGLGTKVDRIRALQVEMAVRPIYEGTSNLVMDAWPELDRLGFRVSAMFPVSYDADGLSLVEFDCVMCRSHPVDATP